MDPAKEVYAVPVAATEGTQATPAQVAEVYYPPQGAQQPGSQHPGQQQQQMQYPAQQQQYAPQQYQAQQQYQPAPSYMNPASVPATWSTVNQQYVGNADGSVPQLENTNLRCLLWSLLFFSIIGLAIGWIPFVAGCPTFLASIFGVAASGRGLSSCRCCCDDTDRDKFRTTKALLMVAMVIFIIAVPLNLFALWIFAEGNIIEDCYFNGTYYYCDNAQWPIIGSGLNAFCSLVAAILAGKAAGTIRMFVPGCCGDSGQPYYANTGINMTNQSGPPQQYQYPQGSHSAASQPNQSTPYSMATV